MQDLIALALRWALRLILPARGHHRAPLPDPAGMAVAPPLVICKWTRPIHSYQLIKTMPLALPFRVGGHVEQWERTPEAEQRAILAVRAEQAWPEWVRTRMAVEKRQQTPEDEKWRRIELFAASLDLPSPSELAVAMAG